MNRFLLFVFLGFACGLTFACAPPSEPAKPDTEALLAGAKALDEAFLNAFNHGDAEAMASLYWNSPETVSFPPEALIARGHASIVEGATHSFEAMQGAKLEFTESHQIPAGDMVIGWGLWRMTLTTPDGTPQEIVGRYTDVKAQRDGQWVYLLDHASVPLSPPPEPATVDESATE